MANSTLWWLATGALVAVELITGTFYLLMMALGLAAAALAAHAGLPMTWQWIVASLVGGGSVLVWHRYKRAQPALAPAQSNRDVNMDVGEVLHVDAWQADGTTAVKYRGAHWHAALQAGQPAEAGAYVIAQVIGSRLILKKSEPV
jgi:membrane protein implicated in regulation of membrane protease activity